MTTYSFELKDNDLICNRIGDQAVDFKIGELYETNYSSMEIEDDFVFLNQINNTNLITQDLITAAEKWWQNFLKEKDQDFLKTLEPWDPRLADAEIDELNEKVASLEKQLAEALDEINWWKKKHKEDCQEIRLVGRREGEKYMKEKCHKVCIDVARSESYYSDNVGDKCAEEILKLEISRSL